MTVQADFKLPAVIDSHMVLQRDAPLPVWCWAEAGEKVDPGVRFYIQFGSQDVKRYAEASGYIDIFEAVGAEIIEPSCGACINAGPGVSYDTETVTVSAINRNFPGRSGPGQLYLASPYTTAASALAGFITAWEPVKAVR